MAWTEIRPFPEIAGTDSPATSWDSTLTLFHVIITATYALSAMTHRKT